MRTARPGRVLDAPHCGGFADTGPAISRPCSSPGGREPTAASKNVVLIGIPPDQGEIARLADGVLPPLGCVLSVSGGGTVKFARLVGRNWPWDFSAIDHCPAFGGTVPPPLNTYLLGKEESRE